jgi:hypothetical protein
LDFGATAHCRRQKFADPMLWNIVPKAGTHQRVRHEIFAYAADPVEAKADQGFPLPVAAAYLTLDLLELYVR